MTPTRRVRLSRPGRAILEAVAAAQSGVELTYAEVGASRGDLPAGYFHGRHVEPLGLGTFGAAADALCSWRVHEAAGVRVWPPASPRPGSTVVLDARFGPVHALVACRVVAVIEEEGRRGFSYGTLPHHVIEGEETFVVERDDAGAVRFRIDGFLRPRGALLGAVSPIVHATDQHLVRRYLRAMRRLAGGG
jgi:uncharacterized protein (UPF0548 family)